MSKHLSLFGATAMALTMAIPAFAEDTVTAENVVATVNGTDITLGQMIMVRAELPQQYDQLPDNVLFEGILDQLVQQALLAQTVTEDTLRVQIAMENHHLLLRAAEAMQAAINEVVTEEAVREAYDAKFIDGKGDVEWNASHILVPTEEEAKEIRTQITEGADFAETAKEKSTGPSGPSGGSLGWFNSGMMVPEFEAAASLMEPGEVSEPVQTQFGWHLIKLNDKRHQAAPDFEVARAEIEEELRNAAVDTLIGSLRENATIDTEPSKSVDPALLRNQDLLSE